VAGLVAGVLLVGCQAHAAPPRQSVGAGIGSSAPATGPGGGSARPPDPAGQPPYVRQRPPAGTPGTLASWAAPGRTTRYSVQLWYAGVPVGRDGAGLLVAYPAMVVSSTGSRTVAHLKVPVFRCAGRVAQGSPNFHGCVRRQVEYADLAAPAARINRPAGDRITIVGRFPTYTYGAAVDRDPRLPMRWTGRTYLVRVDTEPGRALGGAVGVFTGLGTVTLGSGVTAVSAQVDAGYPNRLILAYS
jgi:hypothetical protein